MENRAKRITDDHLRAHLAGTSLRVLAREVGISHPALLKRLRSPAIAKRLRALDPVTDSPAPASQPARKGNPPRTRSAPAAPAEAAEATGFDGLSSGESTKTVSEKGTRTSFAYGGEGQMRVGFGRRRFGTAVDQVAAEHAGRLRASKPPRIFLIDPSERERYESRGYVVS